MPNAIPITNDSQLLAAIGMDMTDVIDDVAVWLVNRIMESIRDNVYDVAQPPDSPYQRLGLYGGFLGAWQEKASEFVGNYITNTIAMDSELLKYDGDKLQHGNSAVDRTQYMDSLIAEGSGWDLGGNARLRRDYWSEIIQVVENGELDRVLEQAMSRKGIVWQRI